MLDIRHSKKALEYLSEKKKVKIVELLLRRWSELKEMVTILQIPYKATVKLQKRDETLSGAFGIWLNLKVLLQSPEIARLNKTNLAKRLTDALDSRNEFIYKNSAMLCAIFLDPRYRTEILCNRELVEEAKQTLTNLWNRIQSIKPHTEPQNISIINCSAESSDMSIDFDNHESLDNYIAHGRFDENMQSGGVNSSVDIRMEIELFQPNILSTKSNVFEFWDSIKKDNENLHEIATVIFAIPPTEVQIERDFSILEHVFSSRRCKLSSVLLEAILLIKLNADIFEIVKEEELLEELNKNTNKTIQDLLSP